MWSPILDGGACDDVAGQRVAINLTSFLVRTHRSSILKKCYFCIIVASFPRGRGGGAGD